MISLTELLQLFSYSMLEVSSQSKEDAGQQCFTLRLEDGRELLSLYRRTENKMVGTLSYVDLSVLSFVLKVASV